MGPEALICEEVVVSVEVVVAEGDEVGGVARAGLYLTGDSLSRKSRRVGIEVTQGV